MTHFWHTETNFFLEKMGFFDDSIWYTCRLPPLMRIHYYVYDRLIRLRILLQPDANEKKTRCCHKIGYSSVMYLDEV